MTIDIFNKWPEPIIFTYHEVLPTPDGSRYTVSCEQFEDHLAYFDTQVATHTSSPRVTFDDGHRSNFHEALPILDSHNLSATFFITAGFVNNQKDTMSWSELRALSVSGHSIQSHGWSHCFLTQCSDAQLRHELRDAKDRLESKLGIAVTEISLPGGRYDDRVLDFAAEAGYESAYCSEPWARARSGAPLRLYGRIMVRRNMSISKIHGLATHHIVPRAEMHTEHLLRTGLRSLLGEQRYHQAWTRFAGRHTAVPST